MVRRSPRASNRRISRDVQLELFPYRQDMLLEQLTDHALVKLLLWIGMHRARSGNKTDFWDRQELLAREMSVDIRRVQEAIKRAVDEQLLLRMPRGYGGRRGNTYRLRIAEIREKATQDRWIWQEWTANRDGCRSSFKGFAAYWEWRKGKSLDADTAPATRDIRAPEARNTRPPGAESARLIEDPIEPPKEHPPEAPGWDAVDAALEECGILYRDGPIAAAQDRGCSPEHVLRLVDHWRNRSGAWTETVLRSRVLNARPDQDVEDGWPEPSGDYVSEERKARAQAIQAVRLLSEDELADLIDWAAEHAKPDRKPFWRSLQSSHELRAKPDAVYVGNFRNQYAVLLANAYRVRLGTGSAHSRPPASAGSLVSLATGGSDS